MGAEAAEGAAGATVAGQDNGGAQGGDDLSSALNQGTLEGQLASQEAAAASAAAPPSSPPPPAAPAFPSAEEIARANFQTFGPMFQQLAAPPAATPKNAWDDPKQYWTVPQENAHETFHERVTKYAEHVAEQRVKPLMDRLQYLEGAFQYAQAKFATDPNFAKIEQRFQQLVREGVPPQHARKLAEFESGSAAPPSAASPGAPRFVPIPPKSATSPATRTATPQAPARDRSKAPTAEESFMRSGAAALLGV